MILVLHLKLFIEISMIFDNEDDIFIFSKNVRKFRASRENKFEAKYQLNSLKKYYEIYANASN